MEMNEELSADALTERSGFCIKVWKEANIIEEELDKHTCKTEEHYGWSGREYIQQ